MAEYTGPKNMTTPDGRLECPACNEVVGFGADPCVHCNKALHDHCFYTRDHSCVRGGDIPHDPTYGTQERRDRENAELRRSRAKPVASVKPEPGPRRMTDKERAHAVELVKVLAASLRVEQPNYFSTLGGIAQHVGSLLEDHAAGGGR